MKFKLILTTFAIAIGSFAFSQTDGAIAADVQLKEQAMELTQEMSSYLDLSETQIERMKGLNFGLMNDKAQLQGMDLSKSEMAEKVKVFEDRYSRTVGQVLSEEQYSKFQEKYSDEKKMKKEKVKK